MPLDQLAILLIILNYAFCQEFRPPNIYHWLEQNSYICDASLISRRHPKFLTPAEARIFECSCGDPIKSKMACGKIGKIKPRCFRLPIECLREYTAIFASAGNRMKRNEYSRNPSEFFFTFFRTL
ncbi:unnamed protein product [Caenorhabditis bovis]|uniref:Uncharacterized protein n=1 Tax=Caenorhabditis bovis TaxID=2654633 RepID=A0A8S1FBR2_9PELO|nr:unnamed protein product [Caenorhabditis bovis]